jgi:tripartite-type tricarboxylate transporter receptor subunit TctC
MAAAQSYPTKPVRIITGSAGTSGDLLSRYLAQRLNERWKKPVIVENRTGGGIIAAEVAAHARPTAIRCTWRNNRRSRQR